MAAPVFGSIGTYLETSSASPAFAVPSGVAANDVIVISFFLDSTTTISALPSGFAEAGNSPIARPSGGGAHTLHVVWKRATGADAGTYGFTLSGSTFVAGAALRYTGCVTSGNPWDVTTSADGGATNSTTTPAVSVTTTGADRMLVFAGSNWSGGRWTPPTGFTERIDSGTGVDTADEKSQAVAGSSGSVSATCVGNDKTLAWLGALTGTTGGGPATATAADTASASDATGRVAGFSRAAADAAGASDALVRTAGFARLAADSAAAADASTRSAQVYLRTAPGSATASDAAARVAQPFVRAAVDSGPASDSATRTSSRPRAIADSASTVDATSRLAQASTRAAVDTDRKSVV